MVRISPICTLLIITLINFCASKSVSQYNVVWTTMTGSSADSMPIGNGKMAAQVWMVPSTSTFSFFIMRADARDENCEIRKLTKLDISVAFPAGSVTWNTFGQGLDLDTATVTINATGTINSRPVAIKTSAWIDANSDNLIFDLSASQPFTSSVVLKPWRTSRVNLESSMQTWMCKQRYTYPDTYETNIPSIFPADSLVFYHRNIDSDYYSYSLTLQGLQKLVNNSTNPIVNHQWGAIIYGSSTLKRTNQYTLTSSATQQLRLVATSYNAQTNTVSQWEQGLHQQMLKNLNDPSIRPNHVKFWGDFWDRSYISITASQQHQERIKEQPQISLGESEQKRHVLDDPFTVSSQYTLWRYTQAIQSRTPFPIKFNGQIFVNDETDPDTRDWGGADWWQNLRLPYYNMLNSGDFDLMNSVFDYYLNMLPLAISRSEIYFNISDSAFFPETAVLLGLYYNSDYGCPGSRGGFPPEIPQTRWNRYNYNGGLDLSLLIIDHYTYTQDYKTFTKYLPIVEGVVNFFSKRWTKTDSNGKLILFPSQAIETYQCVTYPPITSDCVTNDMPDVAGMTSVLNKLLALKQGDLDPNFRNLCQQLLAKTPSLPIKSDGSILLAGDILPSSQSNSENPELYAVHPYRLFTAAYSSDHNKPAVTAYNNRIHKCNQGWCQDVMVAALLGLTNEAVTQVVSRATTAPAPGYRFPVFMPHFQDFQPSADHLSNMNSALQWMLLQPVDDGTILLFPSWPCTSWNVDAKLSAPLQTTVELSYQNGKLVTLTVTPPERKSAVKFAACVSQEEAEIILSQ